MKSYIRQPFENKRIYLYGAKGTLRLPMDSPGLNHPFGSENNFIEKKTLYKYRPIVLLSKS